MRLDRFTSVDDFRSAAGSYLTAREAEHNLILGISATMAADPDSIEAPPYLVVASDGDRVVGAAMRTPPHNVILSEVDDPAVPALVAQDMRGDPPPGVVGPPDAVRAFADAWVATAGGGWREARRERIFRLSSLVEPAPAQGAARLVVAADAELLERWLVAFAAEALDEAEMGLIRRSIEAWRRGHRRRYWFWQVDNRPVSLVGAGGDTPNGIRIGPVYTPPEARGRGYASNLTAWVSRTTMGEGRRFCFLYTDLANPTSNKIYQAIGYEPVTDALMVAFTE
jgi:predicted GNAT family acetyltransferase